MKKLPPQSKTRPIAVPRPSARAAPVRIISRSERPGVDVDYLFAQVGIDQRFVDTKPNCGNMLAGVGPTWANR